MIVSFNAELRMNSNEAPKKAIFDPGIGLGVSRTLNYPQAAGTITMPIKFPEFYCPNRDFLGWTDDKNDLTTAKYQPGEVLSFDAAKKFYAAYSKDTKYCFYYSFLDDNEVIKTFYETTKEHTIINEVPVKAGKNFLGWSTTPNDKTTLYHAGDVVNANVTNFSLSLFAIYDDVTPLIPPYTLTLKSGLGIGDDIQINTDMDGKVTLPSMPATWKYPESFDDGAFVGWSTELNYPDDASGVIHGYPDDTITLTGDCILYGNYQNLRWVNLYWIPWDAGNDSSLVGHASPKPEANPARILHTQIPYGTSFAYPVDVWQFEGYTFFGWLNDDYTSTDTHVPGTSMGIIVKDMNIYSCYIPNV